MARDSQTAPHPSPLFFMPSRRAAAILVPLVITALASALFLRYGVIQNTPIGLACEAGEESLTCTIRLAAILLFVPGWFGWTALAAATFQLWRPNIVMFEIGLVAAAFGTRALQHAPLGSSGRVARTRVWRGHGPKRGKGKRHEEACEPQRLPIRDALIDDDEEGRRGEERGRDGLGCTGWRKGRSAQEGRDSEGHCWAREQSEREVLVAGVEDKPQRHMDRRHHGRHEQTGEQEAQAIGAWPETRVEDDGKASEGGASRHGNRGKGRHEERKQEHSRRPHAVAELRRFHG